MANVQPLRGLRYSPAYAQSQVFAPPYDVIDAAARQRYLAASPYNVVHIDLGPTPSEPSWYAQAAETRSRWLAEGVLLRDAQPAFYGYEQHFRLPGGASQVRRGFIGRVGLVEWGNGIYRHERTRLGPRADRLALMRALDMQSSPVFGLYPDAAGEIMRWLQPPTHVFADVCDEDGVRHIFWPVTEPEAVAAITAGMANREIVIADGHHRYETALAYRAERRAAAGDPPNPQPYDYVLMYLTASEDPGLAILATHRVISGQGELDAAALLRALERDFEVWPHEGAGDLTSAIAAARAGEAVDGQVVLGLCLGAAGRWLLRLRSADSARRAAEGRVAADLALLDVVVLQHLILEPHLGISTDDLARTERVSYTIHEQQACEQVSASQTTVASQTTAGVAQAAFILNPTSVQQVCQAAVHGVTMPQKSTYFFPKLLTGLVFHPMDSE